MIQSPLKFEKPTKEFDDRLAEVLETHFHAKRGTTFWIERATALGIDAPRDIRSIKELAQLGTMSPADLADRPIEHFIPRSILEQRSELVFVQTGGTLGRGVWTAYLHVEFVAAFVTPFVVAARHVGFPEGESWLYVGPSGPHVIGLAARNLARELGAPTPFTVDFDSRWAKKLQPGSFAARRYLDHVVGQAMDIITTQDIGVLFSTPPVLKCLAAMMSAEQRVRIHGVHYGGLALAAVELEQFQCESFPNAVHLSGYGNTLCGCALELRSTAARRMQYFPHGIRLLMGVAREREGGRLAADYEAVGQRGRLVFTRLDHTCLLVNVVERDEVTLIAPPDDAPPGFSALGVETPEPVKRSLGNAHNLIY